MAVVGGMGVVWLTTTLGMVASAISTAFVTGGIAAATAILFVIARKRKFCESMAETTLSAGILASASWAVFVVGLKLPFPVWPAFFG